jgi:ectoine hydroxylase-related dioxygenase (phytanoyl-CoA dioxygenase family)
MVAHPLLMQLCEAVLGKQKLCLTPEQLQSANSRLALKQLEPASSRTGSPTLSECRFPWQMHLAVTIPKKAGGVAQQLHRDGDLSLLDLWRVAGIDHAVSCIWALDGAFTEARGTTRVVLGSHDWPASREVLPADSIPAVMSQGSVLVYTGRTVHGAGHNTTDAARVAISVAYNAAALKQEENQYVSIPPAVAETLPDELQGLLGY